MFLMTEGRMDSTLRPDLAETRRAVEGSSSKEEVI